MYSDYSFIWDWSLSNLSIALNTIHGLQSSSVPFSVCRSDQHLLFLFLFLLRVCLLIMCHNRKYHYMTPMDALLRVRRGYSLGRLNIYVWFSFLLWIYVVVPLGAQTVTLGKRKRIMRRIGNYKQKSRFSTFRL